MDERECFAMMAIFYIFIELVTQVCVHLTKLIVHLKWVCPTVYNVYAHPCGFPISTLSKQSLS